MANRIKQGYDLYKSEKVSVKHLEEDHIIFQVKNNHKNHYIVSMLYGYWYCDCADYQYRNQNETGSFYCKHLQAAQFKLIELLNKK